MAGRPYLPEAVIPPTGNEMEVQMEHCLFRNTAI
jgi:hypothetical protein